jgi:hypothetical protein
MMERVHVVTEPLTDYVRFELTRAYPANVEAGEDVRILPRSATADLALPPDDFWLFDSRVAGVMAYSEAGDFRYFELTNDPDVISRFEQTRTVTMQHAIPLHEYVQAEEENKGARRAS